MLLAGSTRVFRGDMMTESAVALGSITEREGGGGGGGAKLMTESDEYRFELLPEGFAGGGFGGGVKVRDFDLQTFGVS